MMSTARTSYFGVSLAGAIVGVVSCGISTGRPPLPPCLDPGPGSRLVGDNSGRPSCPAATPPPTCGSTHPVTYATREELPATPEHEAEVSVAIDPRPGSQLAYAATIQSITDQGQRQAHVTGKCIAKKKIQIFRTTNLGTNWTVVPGTETLASDWFTDPDVTVDAAGTMYFTALRFGKANDAGGFVGGSVNGMGEPDCDGQWATGRAEVQVWMAQPDGPLVPAIATGFGSLAALGQPSPAIEPRPVTATPPPAPPEPATRVLPSVGGADHPRIVSSRAGDGRVVVVVHDERDFLVTYQKNATTGFLTEIGNRLDLGKNAFAALAMDARGDLYVGNANGGAALGVRHLQWNGSAWIPTLIDGEENRGRPNVIGTVFQGGPSVDLGFNAQELAVFARTDPTPALVVINFDANTDPIVYFAFEVQVPDSFGRQIELVAANGHDLRTGKWAGPQVFFSEALGGSIFHPRLSADGENNILDLMFFAVEPNPAGQSLAAFELRTIFARFDASRSAFAYQVRMDRSPPLVSDLPARNSDGDFVPQVLFTGEYLGMATKGTTAIVGWPERPLGASPIVSTNSDLGLAALGDNRDCTTAVTGALLTDPDDLWECKCDCGSGATLLPVVGCAPGATEGDACQGICDRKPCGESLSCVRTACTPTEVRRMVSSRSCAVADGPTIGAPPASLADFVATATPASNAVIRLGGEVATTPVTGQMFVNASTSPPRAGAVAEIARLDVRPADVFFGGSIGAAVQNITVAHRARLRGAFTDATHFRIEPGTVQVVVTMQTQVSEDPPSAPFNLLASNPNAALGTLDLATGAVSLDTTATDSMGNSLELQFRGTIVSRPPDSDHDGVIDAVDRCGSMPGPDHTPPTFTSVPPSMVISSCTGVNLGQAQATDACGAVTISNDAPAKFPLGTTIVRWTARDNAGNVSVATQSVTAVLGDNTSCCPAGTKIILGTSNNDVLTGTSGADCILGRGGQDQISGGGGNDFISGGDGDDAIFGQAGNDHLFGGTGQDVISGGPGNDVISGGDGVDQLNGDDGNDRLSGGQGGDIMRGGIGNDSLTGDADDDQLFGGDGNDDLAGGGNNDRLFGENGDDVLQGDVGDDRLDGGGGVNSLRGGDGFDQCFDNGAAILCPDGGPSGS